jgi:hypothetical protein
VTVRAEKVALFSFRTHQFVGAAEVGQAEPFRGSVSMVELKRFEAYRVPARSTSAAIRVHKFAFSIATTLTESTTKLVAPAITPSLFDVARAS